MKGIFILLLLAAGACTAQTAYFIDGYHGGIYGHIPAWQTRFMVDKLKENPDWRINLELEPASWDTIRVRDRAAYDAFVSLMADPAGRVEYVNPSYGQSYLFNISGESIIRQFYYGMKKLREHFPGITFTTYSSEEPCFTSALPQLLRSYGFSYASLKNPNTCWGGYTRAYGGELVNWIGPDGTAILTVPRYGMEALQPRSTWQTIAYINSPGYVQAAFAAGIRHPVGMTLQDAGWKYGPWSKGRMYVPTIYTTWREYFQKTAVDGSRQDWRLSQEDVQVSLMWGAQVLQKIARQVRATENILLQAEKIAAMRCIRDGPAWPGDSLDAAWRSLLLAQHHDCWIVPYNGNEGDTWIDRVAKWTGHASAIAEQIIAGERAGDSAGDSAVEKVNVVYNTTGVDRKEWVEAGGKLFRVSVPAMGHAGLSSSMQVDRKKVYAVLEADGICRIESDLYRILIDRAHGGVIKSLQVKRLGGKEFVRDGFNGLQGNFYNDGGLHRSADTAAVVQIVENGGGRVKVEIRGSIAGHPFTQVVTVAGGEPLIDVALRIDWKGSPGIGESAGPSADEEVRKSYYDDRYKLLAMFPPAFDADKVYKNAPFDVTESHLGNTFFNRWDSIKNNVLLNWVDVEDKDARYGLALFSDHTTSYVHGEGYPLGLTMQYAGNGIFYRNYGIHGPTEIRYALMPHAGRWDKAGVAEASVRWSEPLVVAPGSDKGTGSLLRVSKGWEVSALRMEGRDLLVRVFNPGKEEVGLVGVRFRADEVWEEELDGRKTKKLSLGLDSKSGSNEKSDRMRAVRMSIPPYGIRTLRFVHVRI
jgi:alpha-mannosidase